jgi:hypothetical protein
VLLLLLLLLGLLLLLELLPTLSCTLAGLLGPLSMSHAPS